MIRIVPDYLEEIVLRLPDKTAYVDQERSVTFSEVRSEAFRVAGALIRAGLFRQPVGIYMEKSVSAVSVILGILCSGNFYSVLDTELPIPRIERMKKRLDPAAFVTSGQYLAAARSFAGGKRILGFEELMGQEADEELVKARMRQIMTNDLAYVLFTSGSTGDPKGVIARHSALISYFEASKEVYQLEEEDILLSQAPFHFIISVTDIFSGIKNGTCTHFVPKNYFSFPALLARYIAEHKVTVLDWVPSALSIIAMTNAFELADLTCVKKVIFGGEVMPARVLRDWRRNVPDAYYLNGYGSTEITDGAVYYMVERDFEEGEPIPIGKPYPHMDVFLIDEEGREVKMEPGAFGELYIRSAGLASGYYNDPERTREVFVQNPLQSAYDDIVYKTGDLMRVNEDLDLIYVGRMDHQIKYMGQRIELGEIETNAMLIEGVDRAGCVFLKEKQSIVLFYEGSISDALLRDRLKEKLPPYMLPKKRIRMDSLPLNLHGKLDRMQLLASLKEEGAKK